MPVIVNVIPSEHSGFGATPVIDGAGGVASGIGGLLLLEHPIMKSAAHIPVERIE